MTAERIKTRSYTIHTTRCLLETRASTKATCLVLFDDGETLGAFIFRSVLADRFSRPACFFFPLHIKRFKRNSFGRDERRAPTIAQQPVEHLSLLVARYLSPNDKRQRDTRRSPWVFKTAIENGPRLLLSPAAGNCTRSQLIRVKTERHTIERACNRYE